MKLLQEGSIFSYFKSSGSVTIIAITIVVIAAMVILSRLTSINIFGYMTKIINWLMVASSKIIGKSEVKYHRDLAIGKINEKMATVKIYRFINDLIIDLGLKQMGATPYEFLFLSLVGSFIGAIILCQALFGNILMVIPLYPIVFAGLICVLYTRANIAHDARIENVIESENILCSNIKDGLMVAVRSSINVIPESLREEFKDFLDNVEHKNYHIKTALLELNQKLGSVSDDFIKKCIVFETEEELGIVGMFQDVVQLNNIKMKMRTKMKRKFEEVVTEFIMGASMIFIFLGGVLAVYPDIAKFYLKTPLGQIIIALDCLLLITEFVYITYLRAKEL